MNNTAPTRNTNWEQQQLPGAQRASLAGSGARQSQMFPRGCSRHLSSRAGPAHSAQRQPRPRLLPEGQIPGMRVFCVLGSTGWSLSRLCWRRWLPGEAVSAILSLPQARTASHEHSSVFILHFLPHRWCRFPRGKFSKSSNSGFALAGGSVRSLSKGRGTGGR